MNAQQRCSLLAALILAPGLAFAQTLTAPPAPNAITAPAQKTIGVPAARQHSQALIVLNARSAKLDGQKLVLDGVLPSATLFTSRPVRSVGHMVTPDMVAIWQTGSFAKDPPNATVSVFSKDGSSVTDAVLVLDTAKLDGERLTFDVTVLEGSLGKSDGPASVFIDTLWWGLGSNGFTYYGQSQTTGGITPNIGDPQRHQHLHRLVQPLAHRPLRSARLHVARRWGRRRAAAAGHRSALPAALQLADLRQASPPALLLRPSMNPLNLLAALAMAAALLGLSAPAGAQTRRAGDRRPRPRRPRPSAARSSRRSCRR